MKKLTLIQIIFLFVSSYINSQNVSDPLEYFPIHIGDLRTYQMIEYDFFNDDTLGISYRTFEVTGDTVLSDGNKYYVFSYENDYGYAAYYRIDSVNLMVRNQYNGEYYLNATPDTIWTDETGMDNYISFDTSAVGGLGLSRPKIIYEQGYGVFNRTLSKGLSYSEEGDIGLHLRKYLVYAKIDGEEYGTPVSVEYENPTEVGNFRLFQNFPNPFNPSTTIKYSLPKESSVELKIYDIIGKEVKSFIVSSQPAGYNEIQWDGTNDNGDRVTSGVYIYRIKLKTLSGSQVFEKSAKLVLTK